MKDHILAKVIWAHDNSAAEIKPAVCFTLFYTKSGPHLMDSIILSWIWYDSLQKKIKDYFSPLHLDVFIVI